MKISESQLRLIIREEISLSSTRLSLGDSMVLNEGLSEMAGNAIQTIIAGAIEYGIIAASAGAGAVGPAEAAETTVDLAFTASSIISTFESISSLADQQKELAQILERTKNFGRTFTKSKDQFYKDVKKVLEIVIAAAGKASDEIIDGIKEAVEKFISRISDSIGDAIKVMIPDAAIGATIAALVTTALENLSSNCYDAFSKIMEKAGDKLKYLADPDAALSLFDETYPKVISIIKEISEKVEEPKTRLMLFTLVPGMGISAITMPFFLRKMADMLEDNEGVARKAVEMISGVAFPAISACIAVMQMILKGEVKSSSVEADEGADKVKTTTETRRRDYLDAILEEIASVERDRKKLIVQDDELGERGGYDIDRPMIPGGEGSHSAGLDIGSIYEEEEDFQKIRLARMKASGMSDDDAQRASRSKLKHRGKRPGRG